MKLNNKILTKSSTKCHHMVNGGFQSCIVSCVLSLCLTTAWLSSALHLQTHCMWCSHQPWAQGPFVICHDSVRNELMCLGLWKTSIERGQMMKELVCCGCQWHNKWLTNTHMMSTSLCNWVYVSTHNRRPAGVPKSGRAEDCVFFIYFAFGKQIVSVLMCNICSHCETLRPIWMTQLWSKSYPLH